MLPEENLHAAHNKTISLTRRAPHWRVKNTGLKKSGTNGWKYLNKVGNELDGLSSSLVNLDGGAIYVKCTLVPTT